MIEIRPATIGQVHRARNGRMVAITDDVHGVARDLHAIDPTLTLAYNEHEDIWIVYQTTREPDGSQAEKIVTTAQDLDQRIVHRVRQIAAPSYDYLSELDRIDREAARERERAFDERTAQIADRLAWALRKDLA